MKVLILVSCALGVVSAGWIQQGYHGPQHYPVIHNGVPVETPEVQHAKAAHLAALAQASSHSGQQYQQYDDGQYKGHNDDNYGYSISHVAHPVAQHVVYSAHDNGYKHTIPAYETSHVLPAIGHDGKPLDTPEVEAAKADHFAAVHKALAQVASHGIQHHYRKRRGLYASEHGVPEETFEVQHARAEHLAAHAAAAHSSQSVSGYSHGHYGDHHGYSIHQVHAPVYGHHNSHSYFIPSYDHHGRPLDTPEVEHAKALHFAAHHEANARTGHGYAGQWNYGHEGPVDTPEVQHAKALHFAAHAAAKAHHY